MVLVIMRFSIVLALVLFGGVSAGAVVSIGDMKTLSERPEDSLYAEQMRVWLPIERDGACRVTINIRDENNNIVRHLLDKILHKAYYNFYWDRKDYSGQFVDAGTYYYTANDCGDKRHGKMVAVFQEGELSAKLHKEKKEEIGKIVFDILEDTATVTMSVRTASGKEIVTPVKDSLFAAGSYEYVWKPEGRIINSRYYLHLLIRGFEHKVQISKPR